ncbi:hypothetical protein, partial [Tessaracoccus sp.]
DWHLWHRNILHLGSGRPFDTVEEMNEALVDGVNAVVRPQDTLHFLGDAAVNHNRLDPISRMNGHKICAAGNHDSFWIHSRSRKEGSTARYAEVFDELVPQGFIMGHELASGHRVNLSHLPYRGDHTETDRYSEHRPVNDGLPLLCAHVHDLWATNGNQFNVGVDVRNFAPVSEDEIIAWIETLDR